MPIRALVVVLAVIFGSTVLFQNRPEAHSGASARVLSSNAGTMRKVLFKFITSHKRPKPRDLIKIQIIGIDLAPGDQLALTLIGDNPVQIGDSTTGDVLTLDAKNRATGQLGSFPNVFSKCKARYNPKKRRLTFFCKKGTAVDIPIEFASAGGAFRFQANLTVRLFVNGTACDYPGTYDIRLRNRPTGPLKEIGRLLRP